MEAMKAQRVPVLINARSDAAVPEQGAVERITR
jgi:hypothetical protein